MPILALALLVLLYLGPTLPPFTGNVRMGSDIISQYYPSLQLERSIIRQGHLPLWNPYSFGGAPLMANMQRAAFFYPVTLLYAAMRVSAAIPWVQAMHLLLAAVGMYLLLFEYTRNRWAGFFAAIGWSFGCFFANRILMGHLPQLEVCAYLPLLMVLLERLMAARRLSRYSVGLGVTLALTVFAGYPESLFMSAIVPILRYAAEVAHRLLLRRAKVETEIAPLLINGVVATLIALGLSAIQLLPAFELIGYSARVHTDWSVVRGRSMPFINLSTFALPDFLGSIARRNAVQGSPIGEMACYAGVPTLLLALGAPLLRSLRTDRTMRFYFGLLLLSILLSLGGDTPVYRLFFALPGFHQVAAPMRWVFLVAFALPVLAGLSVHSLLDLRELQRERLIRLTLFVGAAALGGLLAAVAYLVLKQHILGYFSHLITARYPEDAERRLNKLPAFYREQLTGLCIFAAIAAIAAGLLRWRQQTLTSRRGRGFALALTALLLVDLWYVNGKNVEAVPTMTPDLVTGGDYLFALVGENAARQNAGGKGPPGVTAYRALPLADADAYPDQNLTIGVPSAIGYDPIELLWYRKTLVAWSGGSDGDLDARAPLINNWKSPLADRWNVRYVITRTRQADPDLREGTYVAGVTLYEKPHFDPRAYVVHRTEAVASDTDAIASLAAGHGGFVEGLAYVGGGAAALTSAAPAEAVTTLHAPDANRVTIDAVSHGPGLLVVADTAYPGWRATVDGVATPVVIVNGAMRGVYVGDGRHRVEMWYDCALLRVGAWIGLAAGVFGVGVWVGAGPRRKRKG